MTAFYDLSDADRIALTEKAIRELSTVMMRWTALADAETNPWSARSAMASKWLSEQSGVVDMGCGTSTLERFLRPDQRYVGVDVVPRGPASIVCDFNAEPAPLIDVPAVACLGLLEYLHDPAPFLERLARHYQAGVVSYCTTDAVSPLTVRRCHAWVNDFDTVSVRKLLETAGWLVSESLPIDDLQSLWQLQSCMRRG